MGTSGVLTKQIGGVTYAFKTLPASKAVEIWSALEPNVTTPGNSLSAVAAVGGGKEVAALVGRKDIPAQEREEILATVAMLSALAALPEGDWTSAVGAPMMGRRKIVDSLFQYVTVGGQPVGIDSNFTGRLKALYQVIGEALKFNFADFFSGLAAVTDSLPDAAKPE